MKLDKKLNIKVNKELKEYLYMLVGKELTYEDKEKILSYFNNLKQQNDRMKRKAAIIHTMLSFKINKVIRYIKDEKNQNDLCGYSVVYVDDLLKILEGSDSND